MYLFQAALQIITLTIKDKQLIFLLLQDIALADLSLLCLLFVYNLYVVSLICLLFLNAKCLLQGVPSTIFGFLADLPREKKTIKLTAQRLSCNGILT